MRSWLLYVLITLSGLAFQDHKVVETRWIVIGGSSLKVDGSTNVNNFTCDIIQYSRPDTIRVDRTNSQSVPLNGSIRLDVQHFDCHNPVMTADLRKTLKAKEFPLLGVHFLTINKYPYANTKGDITKGTVVIVLAGVSRRYEIDYKIVSAENNYINLEGQRKLNFSDFNITPPRKLGGMIKTNDELSVVFNLKMKVLY